MSELLAFWWTWLPTLLGGLRTGLAVTAVCLVVGFPLGLVLGLGVQSKSRSLRSVFLIVVEIGRGTPALILLQFTYFGLPSVGITFPSFVSASLALALCTGAYTSEIIRAGLDAVPHGQKEAAESIGLTRWDALRYVIVPQGLLIAVPPLFGYSILMFQASSLCFAIALPELVSQAYIVGNTTFRYLPILALAAILYALICIPATAVASLLERRLGQHAR